MQRNFIQHNPKGGRMKHNYKLTGKVNIPTGKYWAMNLCTGDTYKLPITNIDTNVNEITRECLIFICDECGDVIAKPMDELEDGNKYDHKKIQDEMKKDILN